MGDDLRWSAGSWCGNNLMVYILVKHISVPAQPHLNHNPNPNTTKSWVRHGNHQKPPPPPPHHKLKLHESMRIEQNLENEGCYYVYIKPKKCFRTPTPP